MKKHTGWLAAGIAAAVAAALMEIWIGNLIQGLTASVESGAGASAKGAVYTVFLILAIGVPAKYVMVFGVERGSALAVRDMRNHLVDHVARLPVHAMEKKHSGDTLSRISGDLQFIQQFLTRDLAQWFYQPLLVIGCLVGLLWIHWQLVLYSLLLVPASLLASHLVGKQLQKLTEEAQENLGRMSANVQDTLGGMAIVKSYLLSGMLFQSYRSFLQITLRKKLAVKKREAWVTPLLFTLMISPILFAVIYGSYLITKGQFSTGELVAFLYLLNLCLEPLEHIPQLVTNTFQMTGALQRVAELSAEPAEQRHGPAILPNDSPPVVFDNVHFGYGPDAPILKGLSFTVEPGRTVALVGASGGGKSTVFKLLCGFHPLEEGRGDIRVFGQSIRGCDPVSLRTQISAVTQDAYLFGGTVAENIGYGKPGASMDDIVAAAKAAYAHDFIMGLPEGYGTEVGERGGMLSGGQRQRITIARALLKDAPILLLDEPTSALDSASEALVQQALGVLMRGRTTMVVAHRLTTVENADEIWVMDEGRIAERGTHSELLRRQGLYAQSYLQSFERPVPGKEVAYT
ncbi:MULTISPECIES: ABC transporter ATP-binding protein [Paenibacillus]|uniref:ABC transporter ATP-binding protein n=1 Tax=Paenibacillus TaxID=44249 RepID=UPI0022B8EC39|nr:ABC transporter ATP-binding protein [Paenibacillus caseinilyticus]MCZ8521904.1 ABC transporter ATP-binding protein [Paenibacillus caseinilyticus]